MDRFRALLTLAFLMLTASFALAQEVSQLNIFTIPNQSASFLRMPSRESSQETDAVFYNPAAIVRLKPGLHFSLSNQVLRQQNTVTSDYRYLQERPTTFSGTAKANLFPSVFAAYTKERFAVGAGFLLVGGAGGATYTNLPSAEMGVADIPPVLGLVILNGIDSTINANQGYDPRFRNIGNYRYDFESAGFAYTPGLQLNFAYKVNEKLAVSVGGRYVTTQFEAKGYLRNIEINTPEHIGWSTPSDYLRWVSTQPDLTAFQRAALNITASIYDDLGGDREIDVRQSGSGFTPIFSVDYQLKEGTNFAFKFEPLTPITLTTEVIDGKDGGGLYVQDSTVRSDLPGFFSLGARHQINDKLLLAGGYRMMFDKNVDWNGREDEIKKNYFELALAAEYLLAEKWILSGGYTQSHSNVTDDYQNELDYRSPGHSFALGAAYAINPDIRVNAGFLYGITAPIERNAEHVFAFGQLTNEDGPLTENFNQTFNRDIFVFAVGIDISLSK